MQIELNDVEVRVLGVLVEKEITTPEYYPLTMNALINACNQKSNREPVVNYDAATVNDALNSLKEKYLVSIVMGGDSRVPKYRNYFAETFELTPQEVAVMDVLMLRGPQTLGELRTRTERLYKFDSTDDIEVVLQGLEERTAGQFVIKLPRQPGHKESRYAHLLSGEPVITVSDEESGSAESLTKSERIQRLEDEVALLRQQFDDLMKEFHEFRDEFK